MYDDIDNERDFWHDEPTRRLGRPPTRQLPRVERARQHVPVVTTPARAQRRPIDPFLVRLGLMLCVGVVMLPIAYSLRHGASDMLHTAATGGAAAVPVQGDQVASQNAAPTTLVLPSGDAVVQAVPVTVAVESLEVASPPTTEFDIDALPPAVPVNDVESAVGVTKPATTAAAPVSTAAPQQKSGPPVPTTVAPTTTAPMALASAQAPVCSKTYTVASGDYWIRIANRVSVTLKDLLAANNATVKSPLYPGRNICLPKTASAPAATTATTVAAKTTATTVKPPASTTAPTTTLPRRTYTAAEVDAIIREVWPDELEDEAVRIATRESNLQPTARNSCCVGLFQIYWSVHKGWLSAMGITSADQLLDPRINATAGLALYHRSGGWGPWAT